MNRDHDVIVERCKALLIKSALINQPVPAPITNKTRSTGGAQTAQLTFKPQSDLKPAYLAKGCSLTEFNTFTTLSLLLPLYISSVMAQSKKTFKCFALAQRNESLNNFFPSSLSFSVGIQFFFRFYLKRSPILPHVILNTINKIEKKTNINFMAMDGLLLKEFL